MTSPTNFLIPVITIDGPTASGKGTVAENIAKSKGFHYLDSGALYRITALAAQFQDVSQDNEAALATIASQLSCRFEGGKVFLGDREVTDMIRTEEIGQGASKISALPAVRKALVELQLSFRKAPGLVADGRDMGTVIFPDAALKVFLTASAEARGMRRYKQLKAKGTTASLDDIVTDLKIRDERDSTRSTAPLRPAEDAKYLDTSDMTANEAVAMIMAWNAEQMSSSAHSQRIASDEQISRTA